MLFSYKIDSWDGSRTYVVDLNISVCLEYDQPCFQHVAVLRQTLMPKVLCDWTNGYFIKGKFQGVIK